MSLSHDEDLFSLLQIKNRYSESVYQENKESYIALAKLYPQQIWYKYLDPVILLKDKNYYYALTDQEILYHIALKNKKYKIKGLIVYSHNDADLFIELSILLKKINLAKTNRRFEAKVCSLLYSMSGSTIRKVSSAIGYSKTRTELLMTINELNYNISWQLKDKFNNPSWELLEETQRSKRNNNVLLLTAILNSNGSRVIIRKLKQKFQLNNQQKKIETSNKTDRNKLIVESNVEMIKIILPKDFHQQENLKSEIIKIINKYNKHL